jgi:hypothetical protein
LFPVFPLFPVLQQEGESRALEPDHAPRGSENALVHDAAAVLERDQARFI